MKFSILIDMLFDLLSKRKVTAAYLAEKYDISPRTVYRYVELLATKLPLFIKRGRNGGIYLSDNYRLPIGFMSADEYTAAIDALVSAYALHPETRFLEAKRKLSAQLKTERQTFVVTGELNGFYVEDVLPAVSEKVRIVERCIQDSLLLHITYWDDDGNNLNTTIEAHALLLRKGVWYAYAFCHQARDFQIFCLGRITTLVQTEETFRKRDFVWSDIPCLSQKEPQIHTRITIADDAVDDIRDQLGVDTLRQIGGKWFAEFDLPDNDIAVRTLLSLGNAIEVISPTSLRERVRVAAQKIAQLYH